jgi:hypothetical protein
MPSATKGTHGSSTGLSQSLDREPYLPVFNAQMRAMECSAFFVSEIAIRPDNARKAPAAIRKHAKAIGLSQSKESGRHIERVRLPTTD